MSSSQFSLQDDEGNLLDAKVEIGDGFVILQSRGGKKGTPKATNTDYSHGLKVLLSRIQFNASRFVECYVDSSRVQKFSQSERLILYRTEIGQPVEELFTLVCRRMQAVGKPKSEKRHTGNANKRIRFVFSGVSAEALKGICHGRLTESSHHAQIQLSTSELGWAEGRAYLVTHLKRERAQGLSKKKKDEFIGQHGALFCENCNMYPVKIYGEKFGNSCIEVHHKTIAVSDMSNDHVTHLEDLQCLCANCHRVVHEKLKQLLKNRKLNA
jgi:hypothetical protein